MSLQKVTTLQAAKIGADDVISLINQSFTPAVTTNNETSGGNPYTRFLSINGMLPTLTASTRSIAKILDAIGLTGFAIPAGGFTIYGQNFVNGGTRAAGASHDSLAIANGLIVPTSLSVSHQGDAQLDFIVHLVSSDGSTEPWTIASSVALATGEADDERFTLGPVTIGGTTVDQIASINIDFGFDVMHQGSDSDIFATFAAVRENKPQITVNTLDIDFVATFDGGVAGTHANTEIFLRKRAQGGTYVAAATAEHIAFTAAGLAYIQDGFASGNNEEQSANIIIETYFDGTNDPITVDTSAAIS